ncbi:MAG TPA: arginase family protein [Pseudomonas sp.]|nr:arginase family protein [Pseudomonas sp.]
MPSPIVLDLDRSVGPLDHALHLDLAAWQPRLRFGCRLATLRAFDAEVLAGLPAGHGSVLLGSGDYHHLSWPLIARCAGGRRGLRVVVFDNHPDNMRYLFGIHCGSWVRRVALLPQVEHVHVVGITSADIGRGHAWENYLTPLRRGKLSYWSIGVDTGWAQRLGLQHAFRTFADAEALTAALCAMLSSQRQDTYLSIDKDVFAARVVRTNWDQGVLEERHVARAIAALRGQLVGSDITGDVSVYHHPVWWKRWLSASDEQTLAIPDATLAAWQVAQRALNRRLLAQLATAGA